ncbi:class I SAM-dependent methyltransferase [Portibacter lacus]|uniref:Methyltransferase domain-containing protein n=1 Tax=Portibacter lacus TaxID=1099794 RepID=A0AA37WE93_9BACT|nr:class I SAM-dependent methyltransferase [Portibacter lacus]GLR16827.1 hypothetical protein GCM10007940_14420 [Portibacter lacus]
MKTIKDKQASAIRYYDRFSKIYDWISSDSYYRKARTLAIEKMDLKQNQTILNIPCGTGQNFSNFQNELNNTGKIVGVDLSGGMLSKAKVKAKKWSNIKLIKADATEIDRDWINEYVDEGLEFDSILCDLGLSGFPDWKNVIDNLINLLKSGGKLVIMDWYIEKPNLRGWFIKWVGKGEVNRPLYQYMEGKVDHFEVDHSFKNGEMFVAVGSRNKASLSSQK